MPIYHPREDSELLRKYVKKFARGLVLDMGTGSGVQAETAASKRSVKKVIAVDINKEAVAYCERHISSKKILFGVSDLFFSLNKIQFDTIIFNPPYLPQDKHEKKDDAVALAGGKKGYELLGSFLKDAGAFLKNKGQILIVFSSLTNKGMVDALIEQDGFVFEELEAQKLFMEQLYCYRIGWNTVVLDVQKIVKNLSYFSHGKRGVIFVGNYLGKKVAVKVKKRESEAVGRLKNEAFWLKRLNTESIGPKLLFARQHYIIYEFVRGDFILDFIGKSSRSIAVKKVLFDVLRQCFKLDMLGVNKEEMHQPVKHILVKGNTAVLLDFERVHTTDKPKNVTQFVQFLSSIESLLKKKGLLMNVHSLRRYAGEYKKYPDLAHLNHLREAIL